MKKVLSNRLFIFIIGGVFFASVTLYAANIYYANEVKYTPSDSSWNVTNVNDALNNLYSMKTELDTIKSIGDATAGDITSGKTAVVKGEKVTGTKVEGTNYKVYTLGLVRATISEPHNEYKDNAFVDLVSLGITKNDGTVSDTVTGNVTFSIDLGFTPKKIISGKVCLSVGGSSSDDPFDIRIYRGYDNKSDTGKQIFLYMNSICTANNSLTDFEDWYTENKKSNGEISISNSFYINGSKLYFNSSIDRAPNSNGKYTTGKINSPYKVRGIYFYLQGTIVYEE